MAGGGQGTPSTSSEQAVIDPATQARPYAPTASTWNPEPVIDASRPDTMPVTPPPNNPFLSAARFNNPYGYGENTLAQYFNNLPSYQQPGGSGAGNSTFASDLASRTAKQAGALDAQLKAAEALRVQQSADALKSYQIQRAKEEAAAAEAARIRAEQAKAAEMEFGSPGWFAQQSEYNGASGGLASLQGFDK